MARLDRETLLRRELENEHFPARDERPSKEILDKIWNHALGYMSEAWDWNKQIKPGVKEVYAFLVELLKTK